MVVAENNKAYITLRSNNTNCRNADNLLIILDVKNFNNPLKINEYQMVNPHGLAVDENLLFITEGGADVKLLDVKNPKNIKLLETIPVKNGYDVILHQKRAHIIADDGFYQYTYKKMPPRFISKIAITNKSHD